VRRERERRDQRRVRDERQDHHAADFVGLVRSLDEDFGDSVHISYQLSAISLQQDIIWFPTAR
jgi:hypothetical protein